MSTVNKDKISNFLCIFFSESFAVSGNGLTFAHAFGNTPGSTQDDL